MSNLQILKKFVMIWVIIQQNLIKIMIKQTIEQMVKDFYKQEEQEMKINLEICEKFKYKKEQIQQINLRSNRYYFKKIYNKKYMFKLKLNQIQIKMKNCLIIFQSFKKDRQDNLFEYFLLNIIFLKQIIFYI
ncbi:unnamed protein product [Paramecium sonneborni]|uniref:Uncharacterized protein n=1 Tax=Paramecium sonneborni TaxID=65129 RepID=A0A8S1LJ68_9CILI|nr:unnamed protein product [Paramecium sonneborni]